MKTVLITGARGFLGRNLVARLKQRDDLALRLFDLESPESELQHWASEADVVFHLAGVNRPEDIREFEIGNAQFTKTLTEAIGSGARLPHIIVSSSIQAEFDNPYGQSKRHAEDILTTFAEQSGAPVSIFRLRNVFGKWCRPNYNSVTATFCHNIANDLPIQISDPDRQLELVCVDDVVEAFIQEMETRPARGGFLVHPDLIPSYSLSLGDLAGRIEVFRTMQETLQIPDFSVRFNQQLYATYLTYVPPKRWEYGPAVRHDDRGDLAELLKSSSFGQIFVSRTRPGVTRGNHYHHTKTEKFIVVAGRGLIRFRQIDDTEVLEYTVHGDEYRIVEIPPGYTHSITNIGTDEMITLFWASETFDPDRPDTYFLPVDAK